MVTEGLGAFFEEGVSALARVLGTDSALVHRVLAAGLPRQLDALADQAAGAEGRAHLVEAVGTLPAFGSVEAALAEPGGAQNLEQAGELLTPPLLGARAEEVTRLTAQDTGAPPALVTRLLHLALPLLLSRMGQLGLTGANAAEWLGGLRGRPLLLSTLGTAAVAGAAAVAHTPEVTTTTVIRPTEAAPVTSVPPSPAPAAPVPPAPVITSHERTRRRRPWWPWALLLLLLTLGGCWLLQRPGERDTVQAPPATSETTVPATDLAFTAPAAGETVAPGALTVRGTGPAGAQVSVRSGEQEVATATVNAEGLWEAEVPALGAGPQTLVAQTTSPEGRAELNFTVGEEQTGTGTAPTEPAASGTFSITEPAADASVPAGTVTLRGTGQPGQTLELREGDTSLGSFQVGEDGTWSFAVPSPAAGAQTYTVQTPAGEALGSVALTVGALTGEREQRCTETFTLSMADGQEVREPFRFGGVGEGQGYSVTVRRGERVIGRKDIPLDVTCGWSYQSRPGPGAITYEVRPVGTPDVEPLRTINLTVR
ncbi:DUF937 domain-containing protein [Deinococcus aquaedulcis]|uniref:DUF937 domain-containing protein n=1 Tax=Deinococcus aquaedulcis TaxID=2840455 RepID=UPI001C828593|nr:DUF937 domain-containing protein [Deinococcus aquaedulcis]